MTKDLDKATETTLALNNAFLASGADADKAARGTEQYIKMIATGKVGLDSWTTLQETMGLALNDLAEAFGYTGKSAQNDLYKALKDGDVTFDQFNEKLVELSKATGGFAETALDGSGGIATAWKNIKTAITNGVAGSITEIDKALGGTGEIENMIKRIKPLIGETFGTANRYIGDLVRKMVELYESTKPYHETIKKVGSALVAFGAALTALGVGAGIIAGIGAVLGLLMSPVTLIVLGVAALGAAFVLAYQKIEPFRKGVHQAIEVMKNLFNIIMESDEMAILMESFAAGKELITDVMQTLWGVLQPIFGALKNAFIIVADIAVMTWRNIISPAIQFAVKIFQTAWAIIGPILKLLGSAIGLTFEVLRIAWQTILKPVAEFLMSRFKTALKSLTPLLDGVKGGFELVGGAIEKVAGWFDSFKTALSRFKVPKWLSKLGGGGTVKFEGGGDEGGGEGRYNGIKYVPRDGYQIRAHRGERVLTAKENKEYKKGGGGGRPFIIQMNGTTIREEADIDRLAEKMVRKFIAAGEGGA